MISTDGVLCGFVDGLSGAIDEKVSVLKQADADLSASLMAYADRRRHYEIYSMDAAS